MYLLIISGFISSVRLLIEKEELLKTFTSEEYMIIKYAMTFFSMIFYIIYKTKIVKPIIKKMDKKIISILIFNSILGISSSLLFYYILQNHKIFYILSVITPISIIFSIIFSYYLYNEKITKYDCIGIFLTSFGVIFLNYDDSPK